MGISKEISNEVSQFLTKTSIQGMSNVADSDQHVVARIVWFVVVVVCLVFSGVCIKETIVGEKLSRGKNKRGSRVV